MSGFELSYLKACEIPLLTTIHNAKDGWPIALSSSTTDDCDLLVACSKKVEEGLREAKIPIPIRTVWNGKKYLGLFISNSFFPCTCFLT